MMRALFLALALALVGCTQFPDVDAASKTNLAAPALLPNELLISNSDQATANTSLAAQVAALQARAAALRNQ